MQERCKIRVKIVGAYEETINKALQELDEYTVLSILPYYGRGHQVIITYAKNG
jgi:hypothetical protein